MSEKKDKKQDVTASQENVGSLAGIAALVNAIRPKAAVPAHYGDIVGTEEDARKFAALLDPDIACDFAK